MNAKIITGLILGISLVVTGATAYADHGQTPPVVDNNRVVLSRDADNTEKNIRDRQDSAKTADSAGSSKSDRELAANIRKAVVNDDSLSTYAHNVKIIVENGKVTLRGPVNSITERESIKKKTIELAGNNVTVDNQIEVVKK